MSDSTGAAVRDLLDAGSLAQLEARLRRKLASVPDDTNLLRRLGDACRQQGRLAEAAEAYARLAELLPGDLVAARTAALLGGESPPRLVPVPTPFVRLSNLLDASELGALRDHVRDARAGFDATPVKTEGDGDVMDTDTRRSSSLLDLGDAGRRVVERVESVLPEVRRRLNQPPFAMGIRSCKISAYHDGAFFKLHQDRTGGAAASRRLGFVYYFDFPPRRFRGGELVLYDLDAETLFPTPTFTTLAPEPNSLVVMPGNAWHEVLPTVCDDDDWFAARFTVSGWVHDEDHRTD